MSSKEHKSQKDHNNLRKVMKIKYRSPQVIQEKKNDPKILGSQKRTTEIPNTQEPRIHSSNQTQQFCMTLPTKIIKITILGVNEQKDIQININMETGSLYEVLHKLDSLKREIEIQAGKEMLVCSIEGIEGYINLGMPLRCIPDGSHMVITFSKTESKEKENNQVFGRIDQSSAECVVFYIHAVGNREQRILKCRELHEEGTKLCVYGFKGETIKATLRKDGRFQCFVESDHWKLINNDTIIANTQPVDALEGKLFQIEVEINKSTWAAVATQNSELEDRSFSVLEGYIVDKYPTLIGEREKIRAYIEGKSKNRKRWSLFKTHRREFRKLTKNSTPANVVTMVSQFIPSVGLIVWDNNGHRGSATCFVFRGLYIFTCRHVLNDIVGEGIDPLACTDLISRCVRVTFAYDYCKEMTSDSYFGIEPWFEISDITLDYCVLKLKENGQQVPAGLYNGISTAIPSGLICMIGYRNGQQKFSDACTVIPQGRQKEKDQQWVLGTATAGQGHPFQYLHMYTQRSFQNMTDNPNDVTYNTFYCGSSGSPVFDCKGSLVAMNTVGFYCVYEHRVYNIVEFGTRMEHILADIKQKHEMWYNEVCVYWQDVEMCSEDF